MRNRLMGPPKPEWHIVTICHGFVVEVNCNGGGYRRVYRDGRMAKLRQDREARAAFAAKLTAAPKRRKSPRKPIMNRPTMLTFTRREDDGKSTVTCNATCAGDVRPIWSAAVEWAFFEGCYLEERARVSGDTTHETYTSCFVHSVQCRQPKDRTPQGLINQLLEHGFVLERNHQPT